MRWMYLNPPLITNISPYCSGVCRDANEVLGHYASMRTNDCKGVTIPSQRRYVDYYSTMIRSSLQYSPVKMYLTSIVIDPLPQLSRGQQEGFIQVRRYKEIIMQLVCVI